MVHTPWGRVVLNELIKLEFQKIEIKIGTWLVRMFSFFLFNQSGYNLDFIGGFYWLVKTGHGVASCKREKRPDEVQQVCNIQLAVDASIELLLQFAIITTHPMLSPCCSSSRGGKGYTAVVISSSRLEKASALFIAAITFGEVVTATSWAMRARCFLETNATYQEYMAGEYVSFHEGKNGSTFL